MRVFWIPTFCLFLCSSGPSGAGVVKTDVCIYGGNAAGVAAAVQASRMGKSVVVAEFGDHIGGLTSGGLGATDIGNKAAIGGISREFYRRIARHYAEPEAWIHETREDYFRRPGSRTAIEEASGPEGTMWTFEPQVAEKILREMLGSIPVRFKQRLDSVKMNDRRITEIRMEDGTLYRASMFIDATYEGDLLAKAGVSHTVGREANAQYGETLNGICSTTPEHQFEVKVDPYARPGDAASGLLPYIQSGGLGQPGSGDKSVQAYNFRLCYTKVPANKLPHIAPPGYDPAKYELLGRYIEALAATGKKIDMSLFWGPTLMPNGKTDINNKGAFSTDFIGENHVYPEAGYDERARIWKEHQNYIRGFIYFLATSPRVPKNIRDEVNAWGPAKDEFTGTDHWPHQLYIREARRMLSDYVMTERNCRGAELVADAVGLAAYTMDSHNCRRIVRDGFVENEGDVQVRGFPPYPISYRSIIPRKGQCDNLLVPVCLSATHIAYGSIRMEPVFMIMGQSAATAAAMAIDEKVPVQHVRYEKLKGRLLADKQILSWTNRAVAKLPGIVVDDVEAERTGLWEMSGLSASARSGHGYVHDGNGSKGEMTLTFRPKLSGGNYKVVFIYPPHQNRATNVSVVIASTASNGKPEQVRRIVNQRDASNKGRAVLGTFHVPPGGTMTVTASNEGAHGYVVADAVQFLPQQ